jgi:hypothetical protein
LVLVPTNTKLTHVFGSKVLVLVLVYYKLILTPPSGVHQSNTNFHLLEVLIFLVLVPTNTKLTHVFGSKMLVYYKLILTPPSGVHQSNTNFHLLEVLIFLVLVPTNTKLTHVFDSKMLVYYKLILTPPSKHDQGCIRVDAIASKRHR